MRLRPRAASPPRGRGGPAPALTASARPARQRAGDGPSGRPACSASARRRWRGDGRRRSRLRDQVLIGCRPWRAAGVGARPSARTGPGSGWALGRRRLRGGAARRIGNAVQRIGRHRHGSDMEGGRRHAAPLRRLSGEGLRRGRGLGIVGHGLLNRWRSGRFQDGLVLEPIAGLEHPHDDGQADGEETQRRRQADPHGHVSLAVEGPAETRDQIDDRIGTGSRSASLPAACRWNRRRRPGRSAASRSAWGSSATVRTRRPRPR